MACVALRTQAEHLDAVQCIGGIYTFLCHDLAPICAYVYEFALNGLVDVSVSEEPYSSLSSLTNCSSTPILDPSLRTFSNLLPPQFFSQMGSKNQLLSHPR